jgi:hypothetical protein
MPICLVAHVHEPGAQGLYVGVGNDLPADHPAVLANPEHFDSSTTKSKTPPIKADTADTVPQED